MKIYNYIKNYFKDWETFEIVWLGTFTIVNIWLFYAWNDTWIGLIASLTGMLCVVLTAKGRISNYYFGIINVILYGFIALQNKFYGEFILNFAYFLPMSFLGIFYWVKHKNEKKFDTVYVRKIKASELVFWILISISAIIVYGSFLKSVGGTLPYVDASSTVLSIAGMILTVRRATAQWILWVIVDIIEVGMWFYIFLQDGTQVSMIVMWSAYLVNAVYGYYTWRKMEVTQNGK